VATEERAVSGFDRVRMQDFGILDIIQGQQESLTVEADLDVLEKVQTEVRDGELVLRVGGDWLDRIGTALASGFRDQYLRYHLTVKSLQALLITGAGRVTVGHLTSGQFVVRLSGAGDVTLKSLIADRLEGELTGAGRLAIAGKVEEQQLTLSGAGKYAAQNLESQRAKVTMSGAGSATVWAVQELDVTMSGVGLVEYYGNPEVRETASGLGSVKHLGEH
jgi:hypothetical protein